MARKKAAVLHDFVQQVESEAAGLNDSAAVD